MCMRLETTNNYANQNEQHFRFDLHSWDSTCHSDSWYFLLHASCMSVAEGGHPIATGGHHKSGESTDIPDGETRGNAGTASWCVCQQSDRWILFSNLWPYFSDRFVIHITITGEGNHKMFTPHLSLSA